MKLESLPILFNYILQETKLFFSLSFSFFVQFVLKLKHNSFVSFTINGKELPRFLSISIIIFLANNKVSSLHIWSGYKGVLCIPQNSNVTEASLSDCSVSYPGHSFGESYPSAERQSVYSVAPTECVRKNWDHPEDSIVEIGYNTEKSPEDQR